MDQILFHVVLAGNPDKTPLQILPEVQAFNLSPASLQEITAHLDALPTLETLLGQLNQDFAVSVMAQCQKAAQVDGIITPEEAKVLDTIQQKFSVS